VTPADALQFDQAAGHEWLKSFNVRQLTEKD